MEKEKHFHDFVNLKKFKEFKEIQGKFFIIQGIQGRVGPLYMVLGRTLDRPILSNATDQPTVYMYVIREVVKMFRVINPLSTRCVLSIFIIFFQVPLYAL